MRPKIRLAILSTHPIQYHSAWFRALAARPELDLHVYYCHKATPQEQADAGFGVGFYWDVPLLNGYPHSFLRNVANPPGQNRFAGFDTPELKQIIHSHRYDAVLVNGWHYKSAWQAIRECWRSNVKLMVRGDSHLHSPRTALTRTVKSFAYPRFIPRFDACLAAGKWSREYFLHYGAHPERIFLVPHAIDNEWLAGELQRLQPARAQLRKQWNLNENAVVFAFVGKFIDKKRPMDFLQAIQLAAERNPAVEGLMVGDGPLRAACEDFVRSYNLPVGFAGFLNQSLIPAAYVASDLLVLPSDGGETWGLVVNEALACGRPCIVSDRVGCGPDLILQGETGFIFPLGNIKVFAAVMSEAAADPVQLLSMGTRSQEHIRKYSVQTAVDGILQCLATLNPPRVLHATAR
jgi:glycosyltransferase involved in cell wall biosynthesis